MKKSAFSLAASGVLLLSCSHKQISTPAERQAWFNQTLPKAYETVGNRNPKWDDSAKKALEKYSQIRAGNDDPESGVTLVGESAGEAVNAGCDDPMILYLYCRFAPDHSSHPLQYWQEEYRKAARGMEGSGYSPLLKFYANDRTAAVLWQNYDKALWQEVTQFRRAAMNDLALALQDNTTPIQEVAEACDVLLDTISLNDKETADAYQQIEKPLFKNWPDSSVAYFIKGRFYYTFAWRARGGGYANQVSAEGWKGFNEKLAVAETAFRKAWSLNPKDERIPNQMIEMAVSEQKDRNEMELWFQRGMQLNTNNYDACAKKLRYLRPEWYGSRDDMMAFGRECVASNWGGRVPLILSEAHYDYAQTLPAENRDAYWRQPDVWPDIQSAYEKFFQLNPDAKTWDHNYYAHYAFICGQWREFNAQIKWIRDKDGTVDVDFFGGEEAFNKMMERANAGDANN